MDPIIFAAATTACVFAGGLFGLYMHPFLPQRHLTKETQDVVRLGIGMLSVLASLVLGLLISTAKSSYDTTDRSVRGFSADLILLNEILRDYGDTAGAPREALRRYTARAIHDTWPRNGDAQKLDDSRAEALLEQVRELTRALKPVDAGQKWLQDEAIQTHIGLLKQRWLLIAQAGPAVRPLVLGVLLSWVTVIFASFGLNAPRNGTVVVAFLVCSAAIGTAVFLILAMDNPLGGMMQISPEPMMNALGHMT